MEYREPVLSTDTTSMDDHTALQGVGPLLHLSCQSMAHMNLNIRRKREPLKGSTDSEPVCSATIRCYHICSSYSATPSPSQQNVALLACLPSVPLHSGDLERESPHCLWSHAWALCTSELSCHCAPLSWHLWLLVISTWLTTG